MNKEGQPNEGTLEHLIAQITDRHGIEPEDVDLEQELYTDPRHQFTPIDIGATSYITKNIYELEELEKKTDEFLASFAPKNDPEE